MKRILVLAILILAPLLLGLTQYDPKPEPQEEVIEYLVFADTEECEQDPDCDIIDIYPENFEIDFPKTDDWDSCYKVYKHYEFYIDYPEIEQMTLQRLEELDCYFLEI